MATTRKKTSAEKITLVPLTDLYERADHPIRMRDDDSMQETIESVKNYGVLTPGTVRPRAEGGYEIIAGRRRKLACEAAGLDAMPVIIKNLDDEQAIIEMVDSGIQREEVLPSEKAAAYKMKLEAIKRQGARTDLTSRQDGGKSEDGKKKEAADLVGEATGESGRTIQRYIRLTKLIPELQKTVDDGAMGITPAEQISYLKPEEQAMLVMTMDYEQASPSVSQAKRMREMSEAGTLTEDSMVLFQVGDFFEMYGEDAKQAAELLGLHLTTRNIPNVGRVEMCGVPAHDLERYVEKLREQYDVTLSAIPEGGTERGAFTLRSIDHEAERAIDAHEAEFGADGTRVFHDPAAEEPAPTVRELYDKYKPVVTAAVMEDMPYRNACGHSDHENAVTEGSAAIKRAILNSHDLELIRLYSDVPEFRSRLHQEIIDETYPRLHELLRPLSQEDIDDALRAWNGNMDSKRAVVRYMKGHARDRDTAAWLSHEYGGNGTFTIRPGSPESMELPWAKVQRRIAQLIQKDAFYTEEELDNFEDIDPAAIREDLESGRPSAFVEQVMADVERIAAQEAAEEPIAPPAAMGPDVEPTIPAEEYRDPLAPAYQVGDTVYLDDTRFVIAEVRDFGVQLSDPTLAYPIFRSESKETFERLLRRDERNSQITDYLSTGHDAADGDLWEVLTAEDGLLSTEERDVIASWLGAGDGNTQIAQLLSEMLADRAETMELETGETADYFTSAAGIEINILDSDENKKAALFFQWRDVAAVLRAEFLENSMEKEAPFAAEPEERAGSAGAPPAAPQEAPVKPPVTTHTETVAVYPAEPNHLPFDVVIETLHFDDPQQEVKPENFRITDDSLGVGGKKAKFRMNMDAINLLKELEFDSRQATPEEQEVLSRYVGWGGLAEAFEEGRENWSDEFKELYATLSPEEYAAARSSTLNAHYTSPTVIKAI